MVAQVPDADVSHAKSVSRVIPWAYVAPRLRAPRRLLRPRAPHRPAHRDCEDGFLEAFYARPEAFLDPIVRAGQSIWPPLAAEVRRRALSTLRSDLESGAWDRRHGHLRRAPHFDG